MAEAHEKLGKGLLGDQIGCSPRIGTDVPNSADELGRNVVLLGLVEDVVVLTTPAFASIVRLGSRECVEHVVETVNVHSAIAIHFHKVISIHIVEINIMKGSHGSQREVVVVVNVIHLENVMIFAAFVRNFRVIRGITCDDKAIRHVVLPDHAGNMLPNQVSVVKTLDFGHNQEHNSEVSAGAHNRYMDVLDRILVWNVGIGWVGDLPVAKRHSELLKQVPLQLAFPTDPMGVRNDIVECQIHRKDTFQLMAMTKLVFIYL